MQYEPAPKPKLKVLARTSVIMETNVWRLPLLGSRLIGVPCARIRRAVRGYTAVAVGVSSPAREALRSET